MRGKRSISTANVYHITARGTGRQLIFECDDDRSAFLDLMAGSARINHVEIYSWCLMGNHIHLLLHADIERISLCLKNLCGKYARYFNDKYGRSGHLFQERFWSEPIDNEEYLLNAIRYIHQNPEKAGDDYRSYKWSSYREYFGQTVYCSTEFVERLFGTREEYLKFHEIKPADMVALGAKLARVYTKSLSDDDLLIYAWNTLGEIHPSELKALDRKSRNTHLRKLKDAGIPVRRIERMTGISKSIIAEA